MKRHTHRYKKPRQVSMNGKKYTVFGETKGAKPLAIATVELKTKQGFYVRPVRNLSIRSQLHTKVKRYI